VATNEEDKIGIELPFKVNSLCCLINLCLARVHEGSANWQMASFPDRVTPPSTTDAYKNAKRSSEATMSKYVMDGVWKGFTPPPLPEK